MGNRAGPVYPHLTRAGLEIRLTRFGLWQCRQVQWALQFAELFHGGHRRDGGATTLEEHLFPMCADLCHDYAHVFPAEIPDLAAAVLLHDAVEDTDLSLQAIASGAGSNCADLVGLLTKTGKTNREYFAGIAANRFAALIKIYDRRNNLRSMSKLQDSERIERFCVETERFLYPIAHLLFPEQVQYLVREVDYLRMSVTQKEAAS